MIESRFWLRFIQSISNVLSRLFVIVALTWL